jgi:hypothetical protein
MRSLTPLLFVFKQQGWGPFKCFKYNVHTLARPGPAKRRRLDNKQQTKTSVFCVPSSAQTRETM